MIENIIKKTFELAKKRKWDKTYWVIDIHDTMISANYKANDIPTEWYKYSVECMQLLTKRPDVCLILYTCSHPHEIEQYIKYFEDHNIKFDYINENPEVKTDTQGYGNYDQKFYMNILFDDKAGFNPHRDWFYILKMLKDDHTLDLHMFDHINDGIYQLKADKTIFLEFENSICKITRRGKVVYNAEIKSQRTLDYIIENLIQ